MNSICNFKKNLLIPDVTAGLLQAYKRFLPGDGKSASTVGIYMRQLRTIINIAIASGVMAQEKCPFKKYEIPAGRKFKKALSEQELSLLFNWYF